MLLCLAFILQEEEYGYLRLLFLLIFSLTSGAKKHIKAYDILLLGLFMSAFALEISQSLKDQDPERLCIGLIHLLNDISRPEYDYRRALQLLPLSKICLYEFFHLV